MATYYVIPQVGGASDSNNGTSTATPWLTIQKAATTMVAGDTLEIAGNWTYREQVTPANSGSSGSPIVYRADVTGQYTGYAGEVMITAHDTDNAVSTRASVIDLNGKTFIEFHNLILVGGTSFVIGNTAFASATAYEGVVINNCLAISTSYAFAFKLELNAGVTPTTDGLKLLRSTLDGGIDIDWDSNASADVNLKILIEGCSIIATGNNESIIFQRVTNGGAFTIGGVTIRGNTMRSGGSYGIITSAVVNTTNPCIIENNVIIGWATTMVIVSPAGTATAVIVRNNIGMQCGASIVSSATDAGGNLSRVPVLLGGVHDQHSLAAFGYSRFLPSEPMTMTGYTNPVIDTGSNIDALSTDHYSRIRKLGRNSANAYRFYFDASDDAVTDTGAVWTNEANIFNLSETDSASVATAGSNASNFVFAGGTNAPSSGGTITKVQTRMLSAGSNTTSRTIGWEVFTDALGESLGSFTKTTTSATASWSSWADLSVPSGGWTWAKVQALEVKAWETASSANAILYKIEIAVIVGEATSDIGAVESNPQPVSNATYYTEGTKSAEWNQGAAFVESAFGLAASAHTITMDVRYDSNYVGTKPTLILLADSALGISETSDVMTAAADTWETLSISVTPSAAGVVRVRLHSYDTSTNGKVYFDNFLVE